jgi:SHS2 domain-containing protein
MLENSVWKQYHETKSIHEVLVGLYQCERDAIIEDESLLYAALKRRLTKKELRGFIMKEAGNEDALILEQLGLDAEGLQTLLRRANRKVRQDDMRKAVTYHEEKINNLDN